MDKRRLCATTVLSLYVLDILSRQNISTHWLYPRGAGKPLLVAPSQQKSAFSANAGSRVEATLFKLNNAAAFQIMVN